MIIIVDTNLICRLSNPIKPVPQQTLSARRALQNLRNQGNQLAVVPQNIYEFWATATRAPGSPPAGANGLGMTVERADLWLAYILRNFTLLSDTNQCLDDWRMLVRAYRVTGFKSHDARLVAAMQNHNVTHLLTFNSQDFKRFPNITLLDPQTI